MASNWHTPLSLFVPLHDRIQFVVDAAADATNHLLPNWYGPGSPCGEPDALKVEVWDSPAWCNPPYGRGLDRWLAKFREQAEKGVRIVALLPVKTSEGWWDKGVVEPRADIAFLIGRVPFLLPTRTKPSQPNHASALVFYEPEMNGRVSWMHWRNR